jgi:glycosyltransferase involved in cell wall biosynthesis
MHKRRLHLLYFTAEAWPTFRQDIAALFGKYLPRHEITCDLVTERLIDAPTNAINNWAAGKTILCKVPQNRAGQYIVKFWHNIHTLIKFDKTRYDAIQVRDMSLTALLGLLMARAKGVPFFYWLSYPQSEGQIDRARARGLKGGMRFWFPLIQGHIGKWLLYRIVLPRANHVFVQSQQMQLDIARYGIPLSRMTPVPMGVDTETARPEKILPADDPHLVNKRVLVYLGTLDRVRQIEMLFQMLTQIRLQIPNILLVLVGDTEDATHRDWLKQEVANIGVAEHVLWTGWLPSALAWSYVRAAEIGLSTFPRGYLLDSASPTKAVEYMAMGLPVVANDNPDQEQVIKESGAGLCVPLESGAYADAVINLLQDTELWQKMSARGPQYVIENRGYDSIARNVAATYLRIT